MTLHLTRLALRDMLATAPRTLISTAGIALGVLVLTMVVALGLGARDLVLKEVVRELPVDLIEVVPKTMDLGLFKVNTGALFGVKPLDLAGIENLGRLEHVAEVYPKLDVNVPMGAQGGARLFGHRLYTDLFMIGLPDALVQPEAGDAFHDVPDIVPVVISDQLVDIYNAQIAPALGSPQLTPAMLTGFEFEIVFGRSLMLGGRGARQQGVERARIVGVSHYAMRLGVTVPLTTAHRLLEKYADPAGGDHYTGALLKARTAADVPAIAQAIEGMGYAVDATAQKTRRMLTAATGLASGVGFLVLLLAALNIAHSFFASLHERRRELGVLRAVGARRRDILAMILLEALMLGSSGGALGFVGARLTAAGVDWAVTTFVPHFPFKPDSFFEFPPWLAGVAMLAAIGAAACGAAWPAWRAARMPIVHALAD